MTTVDSPADAVEAVIRARHFSYLDEEGLQFGLACSLTAAGFGVLREVRLTRSDRIDLLVNGNVGIEVKVAGSPAAVPHVTMRVKRIFPRVATTSQGLIRIKDTPEVARDLEWLLSRWPMKMSATDEDLLEARVRSHRETESAVQSILNAPRRHTARVMAVGCVKPLRCQQTIYWWDTDHEARCRRPEYHTGWHHDGVRWFTSDGYQRPIDHPAETGLRRTPPTGEAVA